MESQIKKEVRLSRDEAAEYLGVSRATLETWASTGKQQLKYYKPFGRVYYLKSDLDEFLARNGGTSATAIRGFAVKRPRRIDTSAKEIAAATA